MDGFWEDDLDVWDTAAGVLLVKEAGGFVTDYRGSDQMFERREYLAANGDLHSKLHKLLARRARIASVAATSRSLIVRACSRDDACDLASTMAAVLKRRQVSSPRSFPLASVAAGYLPILLFLAVALALSGGVRRAADAGQSRLTGAHRPDAAQAQRI